MAKNFPIRKKAISPRFQEAQYTPSKGKGVKKKERKPHRYITPKMLKTKDKTKFEKQSEKHYLRRNKQ